MSDPQGGATGDAGTTQDQPSEQEGGATPATAARETGVDREAADVLAPEGADVQREVAEAEPAQAPGETAAPAPRRRRGSRGRGRATAGEEVGSQAPGASSDPAPPASQPAPRRRDARTDSAAPVVRAHARYVRTSARKARLVCDHIRGKSVDEARAILAYTPRAVARDWSKLLESAVANAEHNHELDGDDLRILAAYADEGPTLKRFQPRAMGRATRIRKRTSHLTIQLTPKES